MGRLDKLLGSCKMNFEVLERNQFNKYSFESVKETPQVIRYVNSDYAPDFDKKMALSSYIFMFGGGLIGWKKNLQKVEVFSSIKAEYIVAPEAIKDALWLKGLYSELGKK